MPGGPNDKGDKSGGNVHSDNRKQRSEGDAPIVHRTKKQEIPGPPTTNRPGNNKEIADRRQNTEPATRIPPRRNTEEETKIKTSQSALSAARNQPAKSTAPNLTSSPINDPKMASAPVPAPVVPLADRKCIFCPIIADVKNAVTQVHHGPWDAKFLVIQPLGPVTEGHIMVLPRQHVQDARAAKVFGQTCEMASEVAQKLYPGMDVNIVTNQGLLAEQSVPHLHVHIVPRRAGDGLILPWTDQKPWHYNTTGKPPHPHHVLPTFRQAMKNPLP